MFPDYLMKTDEPLSISRVSKLGDESSPTAHMVLEIRLRSTSLIEFNCSAFHEIKFRYDERGEGSVRDPTWAGYYA